MWIELLEQNGLSVVPLDNRHVELRRRSQSAIYRLVPFDRRVHPRDIGEPPEGNSLLVAPALSAAAASVARTRAWSVVCDNGRGWVHFHGEVLDLATDEDTDAVVPPRRSRGRPGFGVYSVLRALLALEGGATQSELAKHAQVTQSRVSQTLETLRAIELVVKRERGWVVVDNKAAIDWWVAHYPGPAGLSSHWYGLDAIVHQGYRAYEFLTEKGARPVVSGDVAADAVAPWRTPRHALLYAERGADLTRMGLTPAGRQEATLTVVLPDDPAVRPIGGPPHVIELPGLGDIARAGALQVLWDLKRGTGPDTEEAAEAWLRWMLNQTVVV